jgi:hypothetical protein
MGDQYKKCRPPACSLCSSATRWNYNCCLDIAMEPFSAFAAIPPLGTEFISMYKRLCHCLKTLKYARKDIKAIRDEVEIFSSLLSMFHRTVTDSRLADEGLSRKIRGSKVAKGIVRSGREALGKINHMLQEVEPLRASKGHSLFARWIARWRWLIQKEEWAPIQASLNSIKISANLLVSMVVLQDLVARLEQLRAAKRTISNDMLEQLCVRIY